jgi:quaternary ammonium compound-resistance protein SugE
MNARSSRSPHASPSVIILAATRPHAAWLRCVVRMTAWLILFLASAFEVVMALGLKASHGFTRLGGSLVGIGGAVVSMWLLAWALRSLPVGTGYAVWTGLGAVLTAITGMVALGESRDAMRIGAIALIVTGVVLLQLTTKVH